VTRTIRKILIANRGEIALRIMRTCRQMGIATVAIHSEADAEAPFVHRADEAVNIGGLQSSDSYLRQDKIIEAAHRTGADAIHPGYGFLSENAAFARRCREEGLLFIGPSPQAIELMGSKALANTIMADRGVPTIPGYHRDRQGKRILMQVSKDLGFPVLLKAAKGGGGKGMRIVRDKAGLEQAIEAAKREAKSSFGDSRLIVERYFESARHVEFQIFGDEAGNVVHLFERECTIQRRHQKVIEESPSPTLDSALRQRMGEAAVKAAKALNYTNAGTVEFIVVDEEQFYFLEVNTRLQVEHPVTEAITGLDLVKWQIEVAEGQPLPLRQEELTRSGYAIECRLYAEDPANSFIPVSGPVRLYHEPQLPGVRFDSGITTSSTVSIHYDPMLAKVIAHGPDRAAALRKMGYALRHFPCLGLTTNKEFLLRVLEHPEFAEGHYDTHFIEQHPDLTGPSAPSREMLLRAVVGALLSCWHQRDQKRTVLRHLPSGWRNNFYQPQIETYRHGDTELEVRYHIADGRFSIQIGEDELQATLLDVTTPHRVTFAINGHRHQLWLVGNENTVFVHLPEAGQIVLQRQPRFPEPELEEQQGGYQAPMPGEVIEVVAKPGAKVKAGQPLLILNSMKMENTIEAQEAGTVEEVFVEKGAIVEAGVLLLKIRAKE